MTLKEIRSYLSEHGIENAAHEARTLFSHFTGMPESALVADNPSSDSPELIAALKRRGERYPLQYILGYSYFYRERYRVCEDVLIPREDTEVLVDYAIGHLPEGVRFADLCTGSGCIAISVLSSREDLTALAVDISEAALSVAGENARDNGVAERIELMTGDVLGDALPLEGIEWILSNPPYVSQDEMTAVAPELHHEPRKALCPDGDDAAVFYKHMLRSYPDKCFILEIGSTQAAEVCALAREQGRTSEVLRDYSGNDRVIVVR